jgi:hypothetical protein
MRSSSNGLKIKLSVYKFIDRLRAVFGPEDYEVVSGKMYSVFDDGFAIW